MMIFNIASRFLTSVGIIMMIFSAQPAGAILGGIIFATGMMMLCTHLILEAIRKLNR